MSSTTDMIKDPGSEVGSCAQDAPCGRLRWALHQVEEAIEATESLVGGRAGPKGVAAEGHPSGRCVDMARREISSQSAAAEASCVISCIRSCLQNRLQRGR
eukprot:2699446-Rhodomonas_salina.5